MSDITLPQSGLLLCSATACRTYAQREAGVFGWAFRSLDTPWRGRTAKRFAPVLRHGVSDLRAA